MRLIFPKHPRTKAKVLNIYISANKKREKPHIQFNILQYQTFNYPS